MRIWGPIGAAISRLRQAKDARAQTRTWQNRTSRFRVEQLEPRILLSGDLLPQPEIASTASEQNEVAIVLTGDESRVSSVEWNQPETSESPSLDPRPSILDPLIAEAVDQLSRIGFSAEELQRAREAKIDVVDLPGWTVARADEDGIKLDNNANGFDWYIDLNPQDNSEFAQDGNELRAIAGSEADGRIDLLTVLTHELGHYLGLEHNDASDAATAFMEAGIRPGIRRVAGSDSRVTSGEWNQPETRNLKPETLGAPSITDQLIETLRVANAPPQSEALTLAPTISWISDADGYWDDASNWLDDSGVSRVPTSSDDVLIGSQDFYFTVTIRSGDQAVHSLCSYQPLIITGGSLTLEADSEIYADLVLEDGVLSISGSLTVGGYFVQNGGVVIGDGTIQAGQFDVNTMTEQLTETLNVANAPPNGAVPTALIFTAITPADLTLRIVYDAGTPTLQLIDNTASSSETRIVTSRAVSETNAVQIIGSDHDDRLTMDVSALGSVPISFHGGLGIDTLVGPVVDTTWTVSGLGAGTLSNFAFTGVENLTGAADNEDTFEFEAVGRISGLVDGGARGFDTIALTSGYFQNVEYTVNGPDSGTIARDGDIITYAGLEPIIDSTGGSKTFNGTSANDVIDLLRRGESDETLVVSIDRGEDVIFPHYRLGHLTSLRVNALAGDDTLSLFDIVLHEVNFTIDAGAGDDSFMLDEDPLLFDGSLSLVGGSGFDELQFQTILVDGPVTLTDASLHLVIEIDVTEAVRNALAAGKTRMTFRLALDSPNAASPLQIYSSTVLTRQTGLKVTTRETNGVVADLYDGSGTLLAAKQSIVDLRTAAAGTYYLKVYNPATTQTGTLPFPINVIAPIVGFAQPRADRDVIYGGDGDDLLIGNRHLDRLFGERGSDGFVAEAIEAHDQENTEFRGNVASGEDTATSQRELKPADPVIDDYFHDNGLRIALARALGQPVTTKHNGSFIAQEPIHAGQMAQLTRLDLSGLGIADLPGLEFAVNLRVLALAGNRITDLSPLMPATVSSGQAVGTPVGLQRLEYISVDFNLVTDLSPLEGLSRLKAVSLDGKPELNVALPITGDLLRTVPNPTALSGEWFGWSIAASGDFVAVGTPNEDAGAQDAGAVYVFDVRTGALLRTIVNPAPAVGDNFGRAVAVDGDLLLVGAPSDDAGANNAGSAYVFNIRTGALLMTLPNPAPFAGDQFGSSVAIFGSRALVGASFDDAGAVDAGSVYLFDALTGNVLLPALTKAASLASDQFGTSVALSNDYILVGAPGDETGAPNTGAAYLYDARTGAFVRALLNPTPLSNDSFGSAVALAGDRSIVGAPQANVGSVANAGKVYTFDNKTGVRQLTLTKPVGASFFDLFGSSLAASSELIAVGVPRNDQDGRFDTGAVYLFDAKSGDLLQMLLNPALTTEDHVGEAVALAHGMVVVGAPLADPSGVSEAGAVYLFQGQKIRGLAPLRSLASLQSLSASNNQIEDITPLAGLDALQLVFLDGNEIADIGAFAGQYVIDDGGPGYSERILGLDGGWQASIGAVISAFDQDYRFHAAVNSVATVVASWEFTNLVPGTYEVFATWPAHESRASNAPYTTVVLTTHPDGTLTEQSTTRLIIQKFAPNGAVVGGRPWESLGVFSIDGTALRVELTNNADGAVAADAIRLVRIDPATGLPLAVMPNLKVLNLKGNPLNANSQDIFVPRLAARDADDSNFAFIFDANTATPQWTSVLGPQAIPQGGSLTLLLSATDANAGDVVSYTAVSDNPDIETSIVGNRLTITPAAKFVGVTRITVSARDGPYGPGDGHGRSAEQSFDLSVGLAMVTGAKWNDLDRDGVRDGNEGPIEGVEIFLDINGNGALDRPAAPTAMTPWFAVDQLSGGSLIGSSSSGYLAFDSQGRLYTSDAHFLNDRIHRYEPALGAFVPFTPVGVQEARSPRSIAFGADGALYVAASFDANIRIYDGVSGAFLGTTWGADDGTWSGAGGDAGLIAVGPDHRILYVLDLNLNANPAPTQVKILRFDTLTHTLLGNFAVDRIAGVFSVPSDIAIDPDGNIYLADASLRSVVRLNGTSGAAMPAPGQTGAVFIAPGGAAIGANPKIAFDQAGNLSVASDLGGVARYSGITGLLLGVAPTGLTQFNAVDIAFDSQGRLYRSVGGIRVSVSVQGEPIALTDANGSYAFSGLEPGTYTVVELVPVNSLQTFDLSQAPVAPIDINPGVAASSPSGFTIFNNSLYFTANGGDGAGFELWRFDGKNATRISDINPGLGDSGPTGFKVFKNALYFRAFDGGGAGAFGSELWRYDGTSLTRITDIFVGSPSSAPSELTIFKDALYFVATDATFGSEMWRYDGTTVTRITDINPGSGLSGPTNFTEYNNALYFSATDAGTAGTFGRELWRYDGTTVTRISDINPGPNPSFPANLMAFGGFLYFSAQDAGTAGTFGRELYRHNGSTVSRVTDINPGTGSSSPSNLIAFSGTLYFTATDPTFGTELWRYANPVLTRITDINPGTGSSSPINLIVFNNALYFSAADSGTAGTFGRELWRYDGTTVGRATDINPGIGSSNPGNLIVFDNTLYFAAADAGTAGTVGTELWKYDGTTVSLATDINTGTLSSSPNSPIIFDGSLFVRATSAAQGDDVWRYTLRRQSGAYTVFLPAGQGAARRDFGNLRVADGGADRETFEATPINLTALVTDPNPANGSNFSLLWQVVADNGQVIPNGTAQNFNFTPNDDGRYTVTFTVTDLDDGNRQYVDTVDVFVSNVAPSSLEAGADTELNEGQTLTQLATFSDPGSDVWTATIDYGDGSPIETIPSSELTDQAFALNHIYTDSGLFTVIVTVSDDNGGSVSASFQVMSHNLSPAADAGADQAADEGTPVTLIATVTDPGASDTHSYLWSVVSTNGEVIPNGTSAAFSFTPADEGTYTVTLTVSDDDGAAVTDSAVVTVSNIAPTIILSGAVSVDEGSLYSLTIGAVSDPGADTVTQYRINWGDGSPVELFTQAELNTLGRIVTHTYVNGTILRTISLDLTDEDGLHLAAGILDVSVQNVAPALSGLLRSAATVNENEILTFSGSFSDPGLQDAFIITIDWGDGFIENIARSSGSTSFTAAHRYLDDNPTGTPSDVYLIKVAVADESANSAEMLTTITVNNAAPKIENLTIAASAPHEDATLTVSGTVSDDGTLDSHTLTVNWGDGSAAQVLALSPAQTFSANHLYNLPGSYTVIVTATDDDGGSTSASQLVIFANFAPAIAASAPAMVNEGERFAAEGSFADLSGPEDSFSATVRYDNGPLLPLALNADKTFVLETVFTDDSPHTATVTITDAFGGSDTEVFNIDVQNVAPAIELGADATIDAGVRFLRTVNFSDPGQDTWTALINYGDNSPAQNIALLSRSLTLDHVYSEAGVFTLTVQLSDDNGGVTNDSTVVQAVSPGAPAFAVERLQATSTGFIISFTRAPNLSGLNLVDTQTGGLGAADVELTGAIGGPVSGSLVFDQTRRQMTFVKTGGPLLPDTYAVTLKSGVNGFRADDGSMLDGNQTSGAGDPYIAAFAISPQGLPTLSLPDFARGPGQTVNVPASGAGIPLRISDGLGVNSVDLVFTYDPDLLTISGITPSATLPSSASVQPNLTLPGTVRLHIALPTALNAGLQDLLFIQATVPSTAPYRAKHVLHFTDARVNELQTVGDDSIHVVAYPGDATGTGTYSALDGQRILRVAAGLDSGFALFPLLDPVLVGDVTGNGLITSLDATRILQEVVGIDRPEIPPLPGIVVPAPVADPLVSMPTDITGTPGSTVTVPVNIDNADLLESVVLKIVYDTSLLDVTSSGIRTGSLTGGGSLLVNVDDAAGTIYISLLTQPALTAGSGSLLEIDFQIRSEAAFGATLIDLQSLSLNEGQLVLTIDPIVGVDETDGRITIESAVTTDSSREPIDSPRINDESIIEQVPGDSNITVSFDAWNETTSDGSAVETRNSKPLNPRHSILTHPPSTLHPRPSTPDPQSLTPSSQKPSSN